MQIDNINKNLKIGIDLLKKKGAENDQKAKFVLKKAKAVAKKLKTWKQNN